jgi:N-methylhydantoinase A
MGAGRVNLRVRGPIVVGVDAGGTFTDFVVRVGGRLKVHKVPSTPADPSLAVERGLTDLGLRRSGVVVVHGSTVATNALLTRSVARTAFVTNRGFEDLIEIGRQSRPRLYDLEPRRPAPLVPRSLRFGVKQRSGPRGERLQSPSASELAGLARRIRRSGAEAIAVGLLHAYADPSPERRLGRILGRLGLPVSLSHRVTDEHREYERFSTTIANAALLPVAGRSLERLAGRVAPARLRIMRSNGGALSAREAAREPVHTVLSGPAGGVVGALEVARRAGIERFITLDMGGTSTDVSLVPGGIQFAADLEVGGLPLRLPVIDIHTVGAGGGSIAWIDSGGALRVGPRSAGADPGPVCYGKGTELTVTDAHLFLGRLDPAGLLGGTLPLDRDRVAAEMRRLARRLGVTPLEAARGIVAVASAGMERAIRVISVMRGHDPRHYALFCFGGAAGLHAADLVAALDMPLAVLPEGPGLLSARGMTVAEIARDYARTLLGGAAPAYEALVRALVPLRRRAIADLAREGARPGQVRFSASVDARYRGQSFELNVPLDPGWIDAFHAAHRRRYGYDRPGQPVEAVTLRCRASVPGPRETSAAAESVRLEWSGAPAGGHRHGQEAPIVPRASLGPGRTLHGPAVVTEYSATTWVPPGFAVRLDRRRNLILWRPR